MTLCRCLWPTFVVAALVTAIVSSSARAGLLDGIGVIGDGGQSTGAVGSPPLVIHTQRGLNFGSSMAYDYAYVGASSTSVLRSGDSIAQLVPQVQAHNVTLALMQLGENDVLSLRSAIANGSLAGGQLLQDQNLLESNIETAVNAVLAAGGQVILGGISDQANSPGAVADATQKARLESALSTSEARLAAFAASKGIPFVDFYGLEKSVFDSGHFVVGGVNISLTAGTDSHDFFYDSVHAGIVINGEVANLWLQAMNEGYGTNIQLLSDQEILNLAGIGNEYVPPSTFSTASNLSQFVAVVPEPSTITLLAVGLSALVACHVRRRSTSPA